jgi:nucleoside permease NupC
MGAEMKYLLAASFMAAPGGLLMAKLLKPDDPATVTKGHEKLKMEDSDHENVILADDARYLHLANVRGGMKLWRLYEALQVQ